MNNILVYSEELQVTCNILESVKGIAEELDTQLTAVAINQEPESLLMAGADVVYSYEKEGLEDFFVEPYRSLILEVVKEAEAGYIFLGASKRGKELAPRVAAALNTVCITECSEFTVDEKGWFRAKRLAYGGSAIVTEVARSTPITATLYPRKESQTEKKDWGGRIVKMEYTPPEPRTRLIERRKKSKGLVDLENAQMIVSAGRGFKSQEDLEMLRELAELLDAEVGCSRPVAADQGWMDDWVGISGKKVYPRLYLACGISGTIQHAAGMRESRLIVSINDDEHAGIHQLSDYSIIGDIYEVIPALIKALKDLN
jgi:electron transfer flavoprotein alpha subunit